MEQVYGAGLHELRLRDRGDDADHGLVGEKHRSLGEGVQIAGEAQSGEMIEESSGKSSRPIKVGNLLFRKTQVLQEGQQGLQPGGDEESPAGRKIPYSEFEGSRLIHAFAQIGFQHRKLVEIGQEGAGQGIHNDRCS